MPCLLLIVEVILKVLKVSLIQIIDINQHTEWQTVQIQISWLLQKPTDLDLDCLQRQGISGFSMTRVKYQLHLSNCRKQYEHKLILFYLVSCFWNNLSDSSWQIFHRRSTEVINILNYLFQLTCFISRKTVSELAQKRSCYISGSLTPLIFFSLNLYFLAFLGKLMMDVL